MRSNVTDKTASLEADLVLKSERIRFRVEKFKNGLILLHDRRSIGIIIKIFWKQRNSW